MRTYLRRNSIFVRIFTGLSLLSLAMVLFLGLWMNNISSQNYRRQTALSALGRLKQADEVMGLTVEMLSQNMAQMMWSNDFITYMVSPRKADPGQDYRIIRQLNSIVSGSEPVRTAFLYSPLGGEIYDSTSVFRAEEYSDWPILQEHLKKENKAERKKDTMTAATVLFYDGRMLLIQDLDIASHIGTLVYELNIQEISDTLGLLGPSEEAEIFVYDQTGEAVFNGLSAYETPVTEWENETAFINFENLKLRAGGMTRGFYRYDSPESGWRYVMPLDTRGLSVKFRDILPMYILASVVFLLVSIMFDFYVSSSIYRPINRLMKLVSQSDGRRKPSGDGEIDFLEGAYSDAIDQHDQLKGLVAGIAPEILDSMLKNLMVGKALEKQRVAEILEGVGNPIQVQGRYLVTACLLNEPKGRAVSDAELNLHLLSIRKLVMGMETADYRLYDVRTEKMIVAIVMGFPADYSVVSIKREYAKIFQLLQRLGEKLPYNLQVERGSIYQNIMDIRYAYREVIEKLQYLRYMGNSGESEQEDSDTDTGQVVNRRYFRERAKSLVEQAVCGSKEDLDTLIHQILNDLERDEHDLDAFKSMAEVFLDDLTERVISLPLSREEQKLLEATHASTLPEHSVDRGELASHVLKYARMAAGLLHTYSRKNSFKYVKLAQEYINQNYADSNLSLNDVCEHIGISSSYLSELFNEVSGEKFSTYLAAFRVGKAKQLLRTTNMTIKEIGFCCGFNSIQNFIRVFKKQTDQTPGHYREEQS